MRRITNTSGPNYVPPDERVAVFDSDGTLWCEQPASALAFFVMQRLRDLPEDEVDAITRGPRDAASAEDIEYFRSLELRDLSEILARANAGLTPEQFVTQAHSFLGAVVHPRFGVPFGRLTYRPMLELLAFLHAKAFRTFIVTGGGVEFVRASSEELYGVPRDRVAGAAVDYTFARLDGKILVIRTRTLVGDAGEGEAKVSSIQQRIGRRPILAVGNSLGDRDMLEYTTSGTQPSLCLLIHHDDPVREYAYSPAADSDGQTFLDEAAERGWHVVSMRSDFRRIFIGPESSRRDSLWRDARSMRGA